MKALAVLGPTAVGKTSVALGLARALGGDVISFDSRQVFSGVAICSNAPTEAELDGIPVHLVGILEPSEEITAAGYVALARAASGQVEAGRRQVLTAGTGMYLKAYLDNLDLGGMGAVPGLREQLEAEAARDLPGLARRLQDLSPELAAATDLRNPVRVVRRMELLWAAAMAGDVRTEEERDRLDSTKIGLSLAPALLNERIRQRTRDMLASGWRQEVERLLDHRPPASAQVLKSIGVAEMVAHLQGRLGEAAMLEAVEVRTRQYAKRQRTWFRADPEVRWIEAGNRTASDIVEIILETLS